MTTSAETKLAEIINAGMRSAGPVIERVLADMVSDRIMSARAIRACIVVLPNGQISMDGPMHSNAQSQLVERLGLPLSYVNKLGVSDQPNKYNRDIIDNGWKRELLRHTLQEHLYHSDSRFLVREQAGQIRGVLSDSYRRLDSRPLLDAFIGACNAVGAVPYQGIASELSTSVRAIVPRIVEPIPGEHMVFGLNWQNSDFGTRTYAISAFAIRLICKNGLVGQSALKQVHLGGRLPDDLELSARTYRKDTETMISATTDVVRGLLSAPAIDRQAAKITAAAELEIDVAAAVRKLTALTKGEAEQVKRAFNSPEVEMLPPGKTAWRLSNALSWTAHQAEPERRIELETLAGQVVAA